MLRRALERERVRAVGVLAASAALLVALAGCEVKDTDDNAVAGKQLFVEKCGACHTLKRAGTTGVTGPNLDDAFRRSLADGFNRETVKGVVKQQILYPARSSVMPAKLVSDERAEDVAEYVALVAGRSGDDTGALAEAVKEQAGGGTAVAKGGVLEIAADPNGRLAYVVSSATAPAGKLTIRSKNDAQIDHNIALEGGGVSETGEIVRDGGVSEIAIDLEPGEYTFFCSVPGHRAGGMEGKLTVK